MPPQPRSQCRTVARPKATTFPSLTTGISIKTHQSSRGCRKDSTSRLAEHYAWIYRRASPSRERRLGKTHSERRPGSMSFAQLARQPRSHPPRWSSNSYRRAQSRTQNASWPLRAPRRPPQPPCLPGTYTKGRTSARPPHEDLGHCLQSMDADEACCIA